MIDKIVEIKNIGLFYKSNDIHNNRYTKSNLIFAENGLGKTTLVSIFKSLKENSEGIIVGRKTIHFDDTHTPSFKLLTDDRTNIEFSDSGWINYNSIDLEIFDSEYIHKNIFTPIEISRENKVNLFEIIIGEEGKILSDSVNELKSEQTSLNSQIKNIKSRIESFNKTPLISFDDLVSDNLIDIEELNEIEGKTYKEIKDIEEFEKINKIEVLSLVDYSLYDFKCINSFLTKVIEIDLGEIKDEVLKYISDNLDDKGELWIKNGLLYLNDEEKCPFCNQSITNNDYVNLYKQYFSDEYNRIESQLEEESNILINSLSSLIKRIQNNKNILQKNLILFDKWNSYIELGDITEISNSLLDEINTFISNLENEFEAIKQSIIDKSKNTNLINEYDVSSLITIENLYRDKLKHYNTLISVSITSINEFKV
jgi:wobble nucleotide-excising tRNase